jgi:hypothetical protein
VSHSFEVDMLRPLALCLLLVSLSLLATLVPTRA